MIEWLAAGLIGCVAYKAACGPKLVQKFKPVIYRRGITRGADGRLPPVGMFTHWPDSTYDLPAMRGIDDFERFRDSVKRHYQAKVQDHLMNRNRHRLRFSRRPEEQRFPLLDPEKSSHHVIERLRQGWASKIESRPIGNPVFKPITINTPLNPRMAQGGLKA